MPRFVFLRGATRNTTLRIVEGVANLSIEKMGKWALLKRFLSELTAEDIVIYDDLGWDAVLLALVKLVVRYRIVIRLRGDAFRVLENGPHVISYYPRKLMTSCILRAADFILFNSEKMARNPSYAFAQSKRGVAYNPLMIEHLELDLADLQRNRNERGPFRLLTPINFHFPEKIAPLTRALQDWIDPDFLEHHDITWDILGSGHYLQRFCDDVRPDRFGNRVIVHGFREDVVDFYRRNHVCAYLSGFDAFPNVALEASYCGLPILTTPESDGTLEAMVHQETGVVVDSADAFKRAVLGYRDDPELRMKHGKAAREYVVGRFTIEKQRKQATRILRAYFDDTQNQANT